MSDNAPVDLRDLLAKPMSEFPDRPDLPGNRYFYGKLVSVQAILSRQKQTPAFQFSARLTDPGKDVTTAEIAKITNAGFSIADYDVTCDFWLTPNSMVMLRRFLTSLGFPESSSFKEALSLADDGNPTSETIEKIRGLDILCKTQAAGDNGRVYNNLDSMSGVKRE